MTLYKRGKGIGEIYERKRKRARERETQRKREKKDMRVRGE